MRELGPGLFCGLAASLGRGGLQQNTLGMLSTELRLPTFEGEEGRAKTQSPLGYWNSVGQASLLPSLGHSPKEAEAWPCSLAQLGFLKVRL